MEAVKGNILIVDDEESIRRTFMMFLKQEQYNVSLAANYSEALEHINKTPLDVVFADIMLGEKNGIDVLHAVRQSGLDCPVIMITGDPNVTTASAALRLGAFDYLPKPIRKDRLLQTTQLALQHKKLNEEKQRIVAENAKYRKHLDAIFRSVKDGILTTDENFRITAANEKARLLCRLNLLDIENNLPLTDDNPLKKTCLEILSDVIRHNKTMPEVDYRYKSPDRKLYSLQLSGMPLLDNQHKSMGAVLLIRDQTRLVELENALLERHKFYQIIGKSPQMQGVFELIDYLADVDSTVLIRGESGTGKEMVARAIHQAGSKKSAPFISVNCAAIPETLLESELFGYVKGAFTGANTHRVGRFEAADGGTLFLDEIGDMPPQIQAKLLRVIQEKTIERLGENRKIEVDVRILAATNANLEDRVAKKTFREDLYYRLQVMEIHISPLRERVEDVPLLISHFCDMFSAKFGKDIQGVEPEAMEKLINYQWPGNVRELKHALERAFILCRDNRIRLDHLPPAITCNKKMTHQNDGSGLQEIPSEIIEEALRKTGGNKAKAARLLGISRQTVYRKIDKMGFSDEN